MTPTKVRYPGGFPDSIFRRLLPAPSPAPSSSTTTRITKGSRFQSSNSRASSSSGLLSVVSSPPVLPSPVFLPSAYSPSALSSGFSLGDTVTQCRCCDSQQPSLDDTLSTQDTPRKTTAPNPAFDKLQAILQRAAVISTDLDKPSPAPSSLLPVPSLVPSPDSTRPEQPIFFCDVPGCLNHRFRQHTSSRDLVPDSPGVRQHNEDDSSPRLPPESTFPQDLFQQFLSLCRATGPPRPVSPGLSESPVPDSPTGSVICHRNEPAIRHYSTSGPASPPDFFARCGQILDAAVGKAVGWIQQVLLTLSTMTKLTDIHRSWF